MVFDVCGHSPLVKHYLQERKLSYDSRYSLLMKRTEIGQQPPYPLINLELFSPSNTIIMYNYGIASHTFCRERKGVACETNVYVVYIVSGSSGGEGQSH